MDSVTMTSNRDYAIKYWRAVEQPDGSYLHKDGERFWYNSAGERHRDDGPAIVFTDGTFGWRLYGCQYSLEDWLKLSTIPDEDKMMLRLQYA
jgi:hypothetical protein